MIGSHILLGIFVSLLVGLVVFFSQVIAYKEGCMDAGGVAIFTSKGTECLRSAQQ